MWLVASIWARMTLHNSRVYLWGEGPVGGRFKWGRCQGERGKSMVNRGGCVCGPKLGECVPEEWESMEGGQAGERTR